MKRVSLLLDQEENVYQQTLVKEGARQALKHGLELLHPRFANGSSFVQMEHLLACAKEEVRADGILLMTAGAESQLPACKRVARCGISVIFLNRIPSHLDELQQAFPDVLIAAIAPDQVEIGHMQGAQALRLLPRGGFVLLVTGTASNPSAIGRQRGLTEAIGQQAEVHAVEGQWTDESAFAALSDWFRLGADRHRAIDLLVCQNDQMAHGARRALLRQALTSVQPSLGSVPIIGCDGLPSEGQQMVKDGEMTATIIMPVTTPAALDSLAAFWATGTRVTTVLLKSESSPTLDRIAAR
jgi:ABC-type sugar transport system substrate-binding protein